MVYSDVHCDAFNVLMNIIQITISIKSVDNLNMCLVKFWWHHTCIVRSLGRFFRFSSIELNCVAGFLLSPHVLSIIYPHVHVCCIWRFMLTLLKTPFPGFYIHYYLKRIHAVCIDLGRFDWCLCASIMLNRPLIIISLVRFSCTSSTA